MNSAVLIHAFVPHVHNLLWDTSTLCFFERCKAHTLNPCAKTPSCISCCHFEYANASFSCFSTVMVLYSGFALTKSSSLPELSIHSCYSALLLHPKKAPERPFWPLCPRYSSRDYPGRAEGCPDLPEGVSSWHSSALLEANWCWELDIGSEKGNEGFLVL